MKLLIGGSPCTHWSIAQTKNRETEASGIGWELFLNYRIARDKYQPDFFLYENNKSMSKAIREQITAELGVEPVLINSALVSAQSRQRLYWVGKRNSDGTYSQIPIEQPEDKGLFLRDILETGVAWQEKAYTLRAKTGAGASSVIKTIKEPGKFPYNGAAEPIIVNGTESGKARTVDAHMGKLENNLVPRINNPNPAKQQYDCIAEPVRIGTIENDAKDQKQDSQQYRGYSPDGKSVTLCGNGGGIGAKTGLYAVPAPVEYNPLHNCDVAITDQNIRCAYKDGSGTAQGYTVTFDDAKSPSVIAGHAHKMKVIERATNLKQMPIYEVRGGYITIKETQYPIKLADGFYIIRKLTVRECMRLQTVQETYAFPCSPSQAYKLLGNGWTVDVIAHLLSHFDGLTAEPMEVFSMYDGMSCGRLALNKLGVNVTTYYATEIDKYAIQATQHNFPDTVQLGDAFQVRETDWKLPEVMRSV